MITAITAAGAWLAAPGAAPAAASAPSAHDVAALTCHNERSRLGRQAFRHRYGARPARACLRKQMRPARAALAAAISDCEAELAGESPDDFAFDYADLDDGSDAWANCVTYGLDDSPDDSADDDSSDDD